MAQWSREKKRMEINGVNHLYIPDDSEQVKSLKKLKSEQEFLPSQTDDLMEAVDLTGEIKPIREDDDQQGKNFEEQDDKENEAMDFYSTGFQNKSESPSLFQKFRNLAANIGEAVVGQFSPSTENTKKFRPPQRISPPKKFSSQIKPPQMTPQAPFSPILGTLSRPTQPQTPIPKSNATSPFAVWRSQAFPNGSSNSQQSLLFDSSQLDYAPNIVKPIRSESPQPTLGGPLFPSNSQNTATANSSTPFTSRTNPNYSYRNNSNFEKPTPSNFEKSISSNFEKPTPSNFEKPISSNFEKPTTSSFDKFTAPIPPNMSQKNSSQFNFSNQPNQKTPFSPNGYHHSNSSPQNGLHTRDHSLYQTKGQLSYQPNSSLYKQSEANSSLISQRATEKSLVKPHTFPTLSAVSPDLSFKKERSILPIDPDFEKAKQDLGEKHFQTKKRIFHDLAGRFGVSKVDNDPPSRSQIFIDIEDSLYPDPNISFSSPKSNTSFQNYQQSFKRRIAQEQMKIEEEENQRREEKLRLLKESLARRGQTLQFTYQPEQLPPVNDKEKGFLKQAFSSREDPNTELSFLEPEMIPVTRKNIQSLQDGKWLDDEIINFYMTLIMRRNEKYSLAKVWILSTHFYSLLKQGYTRVKKWTTKRGIDIFKLDQMIVPLHQNKNHWTLAVINFEKKRFEFYDSLGSDHPTIFSDLESYLQKEWKDKGKPGEFILDDWDRYIPKDIPQQDNGYDCGVFMCRFANAVALRQDNFNFGQSEMPYFRKRMALDILQKEFTA